MALLIHLGVWKSKILLVKLGLSALPPQKLQLLLILQLASDETPDVKATQLREKSNAHSQKQKEQEIAREISTTISVTAQTALSVLWRRVPLAGPQP